MSCQHRDFLSEELASLSVQEPVSPQLAKGYSPEGNWPALFFISYCLSVAPTVVCIHNWRAGASQPYCYNGRRFFYIQLIRS